MSVTGVLQGYLRDVTVRLYCCYMGFKWVLHECCMELLHGGWYVTGVLYGCNRVVKSSKQLQCIYLLNKNCILFHNYKLLKGQTTPCPVV